MMIHTAFPRSLLRLLACLLATALVLSGVAVFPVAAGTEEESLASRLINVVYDDSNSMIAWNDPTDGSRHQTTAWSEAKYSLMILYAMAQAKDVMNVYYMSDFAENPDAEPGLENLTSKTDAEKIANIQQILNKTTNTHATYFNSIRKAYTELAADNSGFDEKHLIVLTDGNSFTLGETEADLDELFADAQTDGIRITYLAIGDNTLKPTETEDAVRVFRAMPDNPTGEDSILNRITEVAMRVYQRNDTPATGNVLSLNVPTSEIVVFAQGAEVSVGDIDGTVKASFSAALTEADKDKASANPGNYEIRGLENILVAKGLGGEVAVFKPQSGNYISEGTYNLEVKNASTYNVYYKPYLDVTLSITDEDGLPVKDGDDVDIGTYSVDYFLTYPEGHALHGTPVKDLGFEVDYTLNTVSGNVPQTLSGPGPQKVVFEEGNTAVTVIARYLTYISTDTSLHFSVTDRNVYGLTVTVDPEKRSYTLSEMEDDTEGYTVRATHEDGSALTADEWRCCSLELTSDGVDFFDPIKNNDHTFTVRPRLKNGNYEATSTGEVPFKAVVVMTEADRITHKGSDDGIIDIYNDVLAGDGGLAVTVTDVTPDTVQSDSFNDPQPTARVSVTWNGNPLTKAQYDALKLSADMNKTVTVKDDNGNDVTLVAVQDITLDPFAEDAPATATITFVAQGAADAQRTKLKGNGGFTVTAVIEREGATATATAEGNLQIKRVWTLFEILTILGILLLILLLLCGYVFFKKYLPKEIYYEAKHATSPGVETCYPYKDPVAWLTALVPFIPVTASIPVTYGYFVGKKDVQYATESIRIRAYSKTYALLPDAVDMYANGIGLCTEDSMQTLSDYEAAVANGEPVSRPKNIKLMYKGSVMCRKGTPALTFTLKM